MKKRISIICVIMLLFMTTTVFAWDNRFDKSSPVPVQKYWTVKFNLPLDPKSINDTTIYITDKNEGKIAVEYVLKDENRTLMVIPSAPLVSATEYFLYINAKSQNGKTLKEPVRMYFTTEKDLEISKVQSRIAEIKTKYTALQAKLNQYSEIFDLSPSYVSPYATGMLNTAFINDGLYMTNFIRFLTYLNEDVQLLEEWNTKAQHAATLNKVINQLTHYPKKPANMEQGFYDLGAEGARTSNLYAGYEDLEGTILAYMSDSDSYNISRVGHRRWIINPAMKYVGFGYAYTEGPYFKQVYSAMKVFDSQYNTIWNYKESYDLVAWPSQTAFPTAFFNNRDAWSVSLNPNKYDNNKINDIEVTLKNVTTNKTWTFTKEDLNGDQVGEKFYNIDKGGYGVPFCIIFRPDQVEYEDGERYEVTIHNIYNKQGGKETLTYTTTFFELNNK